MRIGCLQFAPRLGDVENNRNRADAVLSRVDPTDIETLDLLVLPELAFSGYNFKSREQILPFIEPLGSGISSLWARTTALKYDCVVAVGYPERTGKEPDGEDFYNSLVVVDGDGDTVANYRKSHLYYTDETWAKEGAGFYQGDIQDLGKVAMGICMDLNPYKFQALWTAFEFGFHVLTVKANLVIISMAWLTLAGAQIFTQLPEEPDMETLTYWVRRLEPIIRAEGEEEVIVVFANRCGVEGDAVYAGTSAVLGVQNGEVSVYGLLGRGTEELLVVNTEMPPFAKLVNRPGRSGDADEGLSVSDGKSEASTASSQQNTNTTSQAQAQDRIYGEDRHIGHFNAPNYSYAQGIAGPRGVSPRQDLTSGKIVYAKDGHGYQYHHHRKEPKSSRRTASPPAAYSRSKASPDLQLATSLRDSSSRRLPSSREEEAPRLASSQDRYSPVFTSSRDGYSPGLARRATPPSAPFPCDTCAPGERSPEEWYVAGASHTVPSGRVQAPNRDAERDEDGLGDLASPTFPEPTPLAMRPKLALSTGAETLSPIRQRKPPRGMQPGNFFSSRDLCTPPETPFDDEPQPFIQHHWVPPPAFTYTPEEPEWPDAVSGAEGVGQLAGRRPSPGNVNAPALAVPARPASRTQEVKASELQNARHRHRTDRDMPPTRDSGSRNSSRARGALPDRRPTPRPRNEQSEPPASYSPLEAPAAFSGETTDQSARDNRRKGPTTKLTTPAPLQHLREKAAASPWNSITIAASPSVFKTEFHREETSFIPRRGAAADHNPRNGVLNSNSNGSSSSQPEAPRNGAGRLKRSKSVSAFLHHRDNNSDPAAHYLPSPALPVHKAYQDMIYSAVEPGVGIDSMWATTAAAAAAGGGSGDGGSAPSKRRGFVSSSGRAARLLPLGRPGRPDILSPMPV